ncbi:MAG TPA: deoxycytidylate deaminase [Micavibrio sp.]
MQKAVDIVNTSLHPANKIAATLFGGGFSVSKINYWPESIIRHFGMGTDIGNSSGTLHAETACILAAPVTEGASLCITDPFCPNCAKNIAESGIKTIYIDHKGFSKDFATRRGGHFQDMSMQVCEKAGISVYELRRKEQSCIPILRISDDYKPVNDAPVIVSSIPSVDDAHFLDLIADSRANLQGEKYAVALARGGNGQVLGLCAKSHLAIGYSRRIADSELQGDHGKYSFILEPSNRLLMNAARLGLKIDPDYFYASCVPTSREQVNMVGAGIKTLTIGDIHQARDPDSFAALRQLQDAAILRIRLVQ